MMNKMFLSVLLILSFQIHASDPDVPLEYKEYFKKYSTERSIYSEKIAPLYGGAKTGRSFALIVGAWKYKFGDLAPAKIDIENITNYLVEEEHFDEVVVLTNEDVNYDNLKYFLQTYFKKRVQSYPQSRFLFAYSGHGSLDGNDGYLVQTNATSLKDLDNSIGVDVLRQLINRVMNKAHHTLVLLNACHAGSFLTYNFGDKQYLPKKRGAHAITAGGTNELTYSIPAIGPGSVFFEVFLDGVRGAADSIPAIPDGIVTFNELFGYIHSETTRITSSQIPRQGDLRPNNDTSEGSFFFIDKDIFISEPSLFEKLVDAIPFGKKATIKNLFAEPAVIVKGSKTKLSWESENVTKCRFGDNDVEYERNGERQVSPKNSFEYQLTCNDAGGSDTKIFKVTVLYPPLIEEFDASSISITLGENTKLFWSVKNAEICSLDNGIGSVSLKSSNTIAPRVTTKYTIHCSTQNVERVASVTIDVLKPIPRCDSGKVWDGGSCKSRCDLSERWNGNSCEDRCEEDEEWSRGGCKLRCDASERWNGSRCRPRCSSSETWDGDECINDGLSRGNVIQACGCWGYVNFGARDRAPACASGWAEAVGCQAYCPTGGYQWAIRCL